MKTVIAVLIGMLVAGCATEPLVETRQEQAAGQVKVLTTRRDGVSGFQ